MKKLRIKLDVFNGPVWKEYYDLETGVSYTKIDVVDNDEQIRVLDENTQQLFMSFYNLSTDDPKEIFNYDLARKSKEELLNLIEQIKHRLSEINDGSFEIVDEETAIITAR